MNEENKMYDEDIWWLEPLNFVVVITLLVLSLVTVFATAAWLFS